MMIDTALKRLPQSTLKYDGQAVVDYRKGAECRLLVRIF